MQQSIYICAKIYAKRYEYECKRFNPFSFFFKYEYNNTTLMRSKWLFLLYDCVIVNITRFVFKNDLFIIVNNYIYTIHKKLQNYYDIVYRIYTFNRIESDA